MEVVSALIIAFWTTCFTGVCATLRTVAFSSFSRTAWIVAAVSWFAACGVASAAASLFGIKGVVTAPIFYTPAIALVVATAISLIAVWRRHDIEDIRDN